MNIHSYKHDHPSPLDINRLVSESKTTGQHLADKISATVGSWPFIVVQSTLLIGWLIYNAIRPAAFDPYPFILLNLMLSFQAAYTGPIVMMSQNRQAEVDRLMAQNDYTCNVTAETEIRLIMEQLRRQDDLLNAIVAHLGIEPPKESL